MAETYFYVACIDNRKNPIFAIESTLKTSISLSNRLLEDGARHHARYDIRSSDSLGILLTRHALELIAEEIDYVYKELPKGLTPTQLEPGGESYPRPLNNQELSDLKSAMIRTPLEAFEKVFPRNP